MGVDNPSMMDRFKLSPRPLSPSEIARDTRPYSPESHGQESRRPAEPETTTEPEYQPPPKKSDPLPKPGDAYRACARFMNRLSNDQKLIHFVDKDCFCEGFSYADLRRVRWLPADDAGSGPVLVLRFVEATITDVRIEGRNLEDIHYWISEGAMPWVWEQPKGFKTKDDTVTIIEKVIITKVEAGE